MVGVLSPARPGGPPMTARRLVVLSAAVGLLLAAGHTTAQVPPAEPGYDKRLKALEDKMDRVLAALQARDAARPIAESADADIELARNQLAEMLKAKQQQYRAFQKKDPFKEWGGMQAAHKVF